MEVTKNNLYTNAIEYKIKEYSNMNFIKDLIWGRYTLAVIVIVALPILLILPITLGLKYTLFFIFFPLSILALYDFIQKKRSVLTNYPLLGRMRFL